MATTRRENKILNPTAIVFGRTLRAIREAQAPQLPTKSVAAAIRISDPAYKLVEIGEYPVRPSRCLGLTKLLGLNWLATAAVSSAIQTIDDSVSASDVRQKTLEFVGELPALPKVLSEKFIDSLLDLTAKPRATITQALKENPFLGPCVEEMRGFLQGRFDGFPTPGKRTRVNGHELTLNPYYLLALQPTITRFCEMPPPRITGAMLSQFEKDHLSDFTNIFGIMRDIDFLIENIDKFSFTYLMRPEFQLRLIFVGDDADNNAFARRLKSAVKHQLLTARPELKKDSSTLNAALKRIQTRAEHGGSEWERYLHYDMAEEEFTLANGKASVQELRHVWLYQLQANLVVFADNGKTKAGGTASFTTSCSWNQTQTLFSELKNLWESNDAKR